ncbi:hypothetical protein BSR29_02700 [Boudabousia liubingyangii]|uniref:AMIN-like domain-containing protein n=1 Tax=Boudabousia liubingyangii TaxID=1921764 RepID=A0A1Q5PMN1_9ACTO|nr:AMIN domain-containing protein [Boudabousia liubingyangii]OKL48786.1 hypothetical protein BSR29_02700 [Boudabousia liubingyangii]
MKRMNRISIAAGLAMPLLLASCASTSSPSESVSAEPTPAASAAPNPTPTTENTISSPEPAPGSATPAPSVERPGSPPGPDTFSDKDLEQKPEAPKDNPGSVISWQIAKHPDFTRLVVTFSGDNGKALGYTTKSVKEAFEMGRGEEIKGDFGKILIDLNISHTDYPTSEKELEAYNDIPKQGKIEGVWVYFDGFYEGNTHLVINTTTPRQYRVFTLDSPARVVMDIDHPITAATNTK